MEGTLGGAATGVHLNVRNAFTNCNAQNASSGYCPPRGKNKRYGDTNIRGRYSNAPRAWQQSLNCNVMDARNYSHNQHGARTNARTDRATKPRFTALGVRQRTKKTESKQNCCRLSSSGVKYIASVKCPLHRVLYNAAARYPGCDGYITLEENEWLNQLNERPKWWRKACRKAEG